MTVEQPQISQIPDLPIDGFVDEEGNLSDAAKYFFQQLISVLQNIAGNYGLVPPSQSTADIATIAVATLTGLTYSATPPLNPYTVGGGTILYDSTLNVLKTIYLTGGAPVVKTFTVT